MASSTAKSFAEVVCLDMEFWMEVHLGAVVPALDGVIWLWAVFSHGSLELAWRHQTSSAGNVAWNMEPMGGCPV